MTTKVLEQDFWIKNFQESFTQIKTAVITQLPYILAAVLVLLAGWILAKVAKWLGAKIGRGIIHLIHKIEVRYHIQGIRDKNKFIWYLSNTCYWIVFIYFIFFAINILELPGVSKWLQQIFQFLPSILAGIAVIFLGFIIGAMAKNTIYVAMENQEQDPYILAQTVRYSIILLFVIWGIGFIGFNVSILVQFLSILLAAVLGAAALGFGLGAKNHVANMLGAYQAKRIFNVGETITLQDKEGVISEITNTTLLLETTSGIVVVPGKMINEIISFKNR